MPKGKFNIAADEPSHFYILLIVLKGESTAEKKLEVPSLRLLASSMPSAQAHFDRPIAKQSQGTLIALLAVEQPSLCT
ncbi:MULTISPECIES: hypothetical protein [unclassified Microcoleus]|uniref:hypothetical protein n=1 Tax=unclassified Microcoleus TaxID=2642155 RepID=UPI002FD306E0